MTGITMTAAKAELARAGVSIRTTEFGDIRVTVQVFTLRVLLGLNHKDALKRSEELAYYCGDVEEAHAAGLHMVDWLESQKKLEQAQRIAERNGSRSLGFFGRLAAAR